MSKMKPVTETPDELIRLLVAGRMSFHELPDHLDPEKAALIRRTALEQISGVDLDDIGHYSVDASQVAKRNCENLIGVAQIPMGIAGPLLLHGKFVDEEVFVPLATTEGALVASTNRGCTAITAAGGATVHVDEAGMSRAPVFRTSGIQQTQKFLSWLRDNLDEMKRLTASTSRFLRLSEVTPFAMGTSVFVRFRFDSGDAMGMNMATIACEQIIHELIEPETGVECVALSGNFCVDKKPAATNFLDGRGKRLHAEVVLDEAILRDCLKTSARELVEVQYRKNLLGSIAAVSRGFNAHVANIVSAFFIATGQDVAHVVGASMAVTCIELRGPESVYASVFLPDVPLGAVGGGTGLGTQSEALKMLEAVPDPDRPGKAAVRLGEILAGAVLAGELSLLSALTSRDLARAHERLGRGK